MGILLLLFLFTYNWPQLQNRLLCLVPDSLDCFYIFIGRNKKTSGRFFILSGRFSLFLVGLCSWIVYNTTITVVSFGLSRNCKFREFDRTAHTL